MLITNSFEVFYVVFPQTPLPTPHSLPAIARLQLRQAGEIQNLSGYHFFSNEAFG